MRLLSWIIMVPVALVVISFAVSNRDVVTVGLWPVPFTLQAPLFAVVLLVGVAGVVVGAFIAWVSGRKARSRARANARRAETAERELSTLRQQLGEVAAEGSGTDKILPAPTDTA